MRLSSATLTLLSLPTLLLLPHSALVAAADGRNSDTTGNAARDEYRRDLDSHFLREDAVSRKLAEKPVIGVKKMSDDEGEKFWPEYWYFDDEIENVGLHNTTGGEDSSLGRQAKKPESMWANNSEPVSFHAGFPFLQTSTRERSN
jgi:hypothetical protein